jgi:uncharacterized protein YjbI with pentapeptide repeats
MNDKKRSLRMRNFADSLLSKGFGGMKISFYIPTLDLSNRTITDIDLQGKTNFKNAKFTGSILNDVTFKDIDLTGANFLKATLNGVTFENCNLTKAIFSLAKLNKNTSFINCNLSNSFFVESGTDTGVIFKSCTFTGANFSGAQIFKNAILNDEIFKNDENFKNVDFTGANFFNATLNSVRFESCILTGVNFTEANLYTKIIKSSDNTEDYIYTYIYTSFVNIDKFNNALFKKAKLYGVAFENCNLTKADFSEAQLTVISYEDEDEDEDEEYAEEYTIFNNVNLEQANFTSATLYAVLFVNNVYLKNVNFTKAYLNLEEKSFSVYLEDTLFVSAVIKKVDFSYANYFPQDINYDGIFLGLDFSNANLEEITFASRNRNDYPAYLLDPNTKEYVKLPEVNFSGAYLLNVDLSHSNLTGSNFSKAILQTVQTDDSYYYINFNYTNFTRAILSGAKIINDSEQYYMYTIFDGAILENAEFTNCWFDELSFDGAKLKYAEFTDCQFSYFSFDGASFGGVSEDGVDTRTRFIYCSIEISNPNDVVLFIDNVSIIKSFINELYFEYL